MADELATLDELKARLDWTLDVAEESVAQAALDDLSEDARFYGSPGWVTANAPRQVKSLVLRAAARYMRNPDGYTTSRAGDETVMWAESETAGNASFTKREQEMLASISGKSTGLWSAPIAAWDPRPSGPRYINPFTPGVSDDATGYVPAAGGLFPFYADGEGLV